MTTQPQSPSEQEIRDRMAIEAELIHTSHLVHQLEEPDSAQMDALVRVIQALITQAADKREQEARIDELEKLGDQRTFAQWVLEREEPVNFDKEVVRADIIEARLAQLRQAAEGEGKQ